MESMSNVSGIQKRENNNSSDANNNNRFKLELASAKQELVSLKERSWKYGCLFLIALFFVISLVGYIVIDKYDIINVVGVSGSSGTIGSNTTTNKNSTASKAGGDAIVVFEEVDVSHKSGKQDEDETTQVKIQTETTIADGANDIDGENSKSKSISIIKQTQIENYRNGTALMLNIHMTHHGGTYTVQYNSGVVFTLRYVPRSANFICLLDVVSNNFALFFLTFINFLSTQQVPHFVEE